MELPFFSQPIGMRRDFTIQGEVGPVYRDAAGNIINIAPKQLPKMDPLMEMAESMPPMRSAVGETTRQVPAGLPDQGGLGASGRLVLDGISAPRRAMQGEPVTYGETFGTAMDAMGGGAFSNAPKGSLRMFAGRNAKTADLDALAKAEALAAKGANRDEIWRETGWFKGVDDKWRWEIDDSGMRFDANAMPQPPSGFGVANDYVREKYPQFKGLKSPTSHPDVPQEIKREAFAHMEKAAGQTQFVPFPAAVQHPRFADAYDASGLGVGVNRNMPGGMYDDAADQVTVGSGIVGQSDDGATLLHEMQHATQKREGLARGGSPSLFNQKADAEIARDALAWRREMVQKSAQMPKADPFAVENALINDYREMGAMDWVPSRRARDIAKAVRGNPDEQLAEIVHLYGLDKATSTAPPNKLYKRLAGEVEARNVETRYPMTAAERRATPPWRTQDVPDEQQIVRRR